ncbi:MAG: hypothetical protein KUL88_01730 [Rhizobium sp.]|nr:hypothetical protein [Rhizobium sp.]
MKYNVRAIRDVVLERLRQQIVEGFDAIHDDKYTEGELPAAAACYAEFASYSDDTRKRHAGKWLVGWPWSADWWKPKSRRQDLVRAAALIVAEIERLDRAAEDTAIATCEACGHAIQKGEAYLPSPATPLCATCAPTYQALIDEPEGFVDDDGEPLSKEDAKLAFDAYIAAGGKPTDSMARVR